MPVTTQKPIRQPAKAHKKAVKPAPAKSAKPTKWGTELLAKMDAFRKALAAQR